MTFPKPLPLDHPRVEKFREDLEDVVSSAFEEGVHLGILIADTHRAAAMVLIGFGGTKDDFLKMACNAWSFALEECQVITALQDASEGNGFKA